MKSPAISICVPTYNGAEFLEACLASIAQQTFQDFEVLIVDEQSADETVAIARKFVQADSRFRLSINEKRLGLAANWNRCIELARGSWIKYVFQDDLLKPQCLEKMYQAAVSTGARFVCCRRDFIFEGNVSGETRNIYLKSARDIEDFFGGVNIMPPEEFARKVVARFQDNLVGEPTAVLLHRSVFEQCGFFNPHLIMCCDYEYWYRAGSTVGVAYVPETLATFRVHQKSTSSENTARRAFRMTLLDWFILLHDVVFSPHCIHLRRAGAKEYGRLFMRRRCAGQASLAWQTLRRAEAESPAAARLLQKEWAGVVEHYPRLRRLAWEGYLWERFRGFRALFGPKPNGLASSSQRASEPGVT